MCSKISEIECFTWELAALEQDSHKGLSLMKSKLEEYKSDANQALHFQLVRQESDIEDSSNVFHPDMSHQVFGEHESIFGYKDLQVQLYYSAARLTTYINMTYSDKITPQRFDGVQADDVMGRLVKEVPPGFYTNIDDFAASLPKDANFKPFGELLHSYSVFKGGEERQFEIYKTDIEEPGFRAYHERLQTFILFFIDAASFIDVDDDRWNFFLLFEKYKYNGNPQYAIAGYMTVYNYYAYPSRIRPRISQVLVLPPFQKQGHGAQLLQTFYNTCYGNSDILDITVEDPSENFQRLRDFVDARNCMKLKSFQPDNLLEGYDDDMAWEAREKYKINRRQARRIYEILRLKATDSSKKEQFRAYRLDVKRRLNIPFQKNGRDFQKFGKALNQEELRATLGCLTLDQRHMYLENEFADHLKMYNHVIDRLAAAT